MSSFGRRLPFFAAILAVALSIFTTTASADTYQLLLVGGARTNVYGIDGSGDLVITYLGNCSGPFSGCYQEATPTGAFLAPTALPPSLSYDNGSPCSGGLPTYFSKLGAATCNNGHEVFGGEYYMGKNISNAITTAASLVLGGTWHSYGVGVARKFGWFRAFRDTNPTMGAVIPRPSWGTR